MRWHWFDRPIEKDDADTRISFNDVVFGIVIATIFTEAAAIETLTWPVRAHLFLAFVITLGSYIGYRKSKKRSTYKIAFFNLPMLQFILDLIMIYFYYRLSSTPDPSITLGGTAKSKTNVNPNSDAITVFLIFLLYIAWDTVSFFMQRKYPDITFSGVRTNVTIAFLFLSVIVVGIAYSKAIFNDSSVAIDLLLVIFAVAYRWVKDGLYKEQPQGGQAVMPSGQVVMQNGQVVTVTISERVP